MAKIDELKQACKDAAPPELKLMFDYGFDMLRQNIGDDAMLQIMENVVARVTAGDSPYTIAADLQAQFS